MKQAEAPPNATWTGPSHAGVKSPDPILIPRVDTRFAAMAKRLDALADGHPMEAWLHFISMLAKAQHAVATTLAPGMSLSESVVAQSVEARLPPLAADGHRRAPPR